jgi:hypothetical protein
VRPDTETLELRTVDIQSYGNQTITVTSGLREGELVVLAGAHTVYEGERVHPVPPLYDSESDVEGSSSGSGLPRKEGNSSSGSVHPRTEGSNSWSEHHPRMEGSGSGRTGAQR